MGLGKVMVPIVIIFAKGCDTGMVSNSYVFREIWLSNAAAGGFYSLYIIKFMMNINKQHNAGWKRNIYLWKAVDLMQEKSKSEVNNDTTITLLTIM